MLVRLADLHQIRPIVAAGDVSVSLGTGTREERERLAGCCCGWRGGVIDDVVGGTRGKVGVIWWRTVVIVDRRVLCLYWGVGGGAMVGPGLAGDSESDLGALTEAGV